MTVNPNYPESVYQSSIIDHKHHCACCRETLTGARRICAACLARLTPPGPHLCRCSLPCAAVDADQLCGRCLAHPPFFSHCHCAWQYSFPLDHLINHYKHHGDLSIEPLLLSIWLQRLALLPLPQHAALVPIPIHWQRHWQRGFNQAARLAAGLAHMLGLPLLNALAQPARTPMLQGLTAAARKREVRDRFRVAASVDDRHLILIDDVMTTGSTANEAARILRAAGASRVDVWTLCRVMPDHGH